MEALDSLLTRELMIGLALIGGACSLLQMLLQRKGLGSPMLLKLVNQAAYGFMAASMVVLVVAGFRAPA